MKKRFLAVILALALCMGLAVPAFAASSSNDAATNFSLSYEIRGVTFEYIKNGTFGERIQVSKNMKLVLWDGRTLTGGGYNAVTSDTLFTAKHTGTVDNGSYIMIYSTAFVNNGSGIYEQDWATSQVLTEVGFADTNVAELFGDVVMLKAGQSVQFKLPAVYSPQMEREEDVFYFLEMYLYSPGSTGFNTMGMLPFKLDNAAVDAHLSEYTPTPIFTDVPAWCATEAAWAVERGITNGTGNNQFSPSRTCTDAEILTFLYRAAGEQKAASPSPFTVESWCQDAIDWAYEQKLIDTSFRADAPCTRATALSYIWRALGSEPSNASGSGFTDVSSSAGYAGAVAWAVEKGITKGTGDGSTFSPDKTCGRGEIVTFLYRAYA